MKKSLLGLSLLLASTIFLTSCGITAGGDSHSRIVVVGSTSVQPYAEILAEAYEKQYSGYQVDVLGGGSSAGITAISEGNADIGMSSRSLTEEEQVFDSKVIAKDGLALIVHPDNPVIDLSLQQIRDIYLCKITNWSEFGGDDKEIHVISREEGSGTRSAFEELVMEKQSIHPKTIVQSTNGAIRGIVAEDPYAIGYISLGLIEQEGINPVKGLNLDGVAPTAENIINGSYRLFRNFLFVTNNEQSESTRHFIEFVLSPEGQKILVNEGLISELEAGGQTK